MATRRTRRHFIQTGLCGLVVGTGVGAALWRSPSSAWADTAIRPPGAIDDFYAACVRCGLCVQACPYDTLKLADYDGTRNAGTPYFTARRVPCEMCSPIPCVEACPTGALRPSLVDITQATMGTATLSHPHFCNSYVGAAYCDSCYQACPLQDQAIYMQVGQTDMGGLFTPTVNPDVCTGCGKCEQACIAKSAAIRVSPRHV